MDNSLSTLLARGDAQRALNSAHQAGLDADSARSKARRANARAEDLQETLELWINHAENQEKKLIEVTDRSAERKIVNYALRDVIRHALGELRKVDPTNPLLIKSNRDAIFDRAEKEETQKLENKRRQNGYKPELITFTELDSHESP